MSNFAKSKSEVISKLRSDKNFAAGFVVDNNYPAIKTKLAELDIIVTSNKEAYDAILLLGKTDKARLMQVLNVPYINETNNYTSGYQDFFVTNSPTPTGTVGTRTFNWAGLLTVVGGVIAGVGAAVGGATPATPLTPEQIAEIEAAEEAEKKRKRRNLWIGIGISLAVVGIVAGIIINYKKKKGN